MSNQYFFSVPFANSGDKTTIPTPIQSDGSISITEGWGFDYQRNQQTDPAAKPIDRSTTNWLFSQITAALGALQSETIPEWIPASQTGGVQLAYPQYAVVFYSVSGNAPFAKYVSKIANNTDVPGVTTNWQLCADFFATSAQAAAGTDTSTIMNPALVAQQTALRALVAGNTSQVFNVAPATAATHAPEFSQVVGVVGQSRNLVMSVAAASASATITADEIIVETTLGGLRYALSSFNKPINLATIGAGGMDTGAAPASGFVAIYAIYNPISGVSALLATTSTTVLAPEVYGGANMPAGFTASALVSVWATNASNQFNIGYQEGRTVGFTETQVFTAVGGVSTLTSINIGGNVVPKNARFVSGKLSGTANGVDLDIMIAPTAGSGTNAPNSRQMIGTTSNLLKQGFSGMPIVTQQTAYVRCVLGSGSFSGWSIYIDGYTF